MTSSTASNQDTYILQRGGLSDSRLALQHYHLTKRQGWHLHPKPREAVKDKVDVRIADLATGTGIWAMELAEEFPAFDIVASDISSDHFPPRFAWPKNVAFCTQDVFEPAPAKYNGYFDIVHIRLIIGALRGRDKSAMVDNIIRMLKPGGHLQWEEVAGDGWSHVTPSLKIQKAEYSFQDIISAVAGMDGLTSWTAKLPEILEAHGLTDTEGFKPPIRPYLLSQETDLVVWSTREVIESLSKIPDPGIAEAMKQCARELDDLLKSGTFLTYDWQVTIGRKPL